MELSNSQGLLNLSSFDCKITITKQNLDLNILASQKPKVSKWDCKQKSSQNKTNSRSKNGLRSLYLEL